MRHINYLLVGIALCFSFTANAQRHSTRIAIHGIGAPTPDFKGSIAFGKIEYFLHPYNGRRRMTWFLSAGYLRFAPSASEINHMPSLKFGFIRGNSNHHFETQFGLIYVPQFEFVSPSGQVGYRYQQAKSGFIFRFGAGLPEVLYLTVGYGF